MPSRVVPFFAAACSNSAVRVDDLSDFCEAADSLLQFEFAPGVLGAAAAILGVVGGVGVAGSGAALAFGAVAAFAFVAVAALAFVAGAGAALAGAGAGAALAFGAGAALAFVAGAALAAGAGAALAVAVVFATFAAGAAAAAAPLFIGGVSFTPDCGVFALSLAFGAMAGFCERGGQLKQTEARMPAPYGW